MVTGVGVARPLDVWDIGDWEIGKSGTLKYKSPIPQRHTSDFNFVKLLTFKLFFDRTN
jgi:hypothetical protein